MTRTLLQLACFIVLLSCTDHKLLPDPMATACDKCGKSQAEMEWLGTLIENAKTNAGQMGDIYAVPYDGNTFFIHQPVIMSCLGCYVYDCEGNLIEYTAVDRQKLLSGMNKSNLIFRSTIE
ncbi:hypothetical protein KK083_25195 [Fulvivirgaceae bacterium PWU4]|uniref:Uncharacterized protein n=1 Tax=Chryseosolibacter histidini TaxID=2782349 RepID=A0AAP2GLK2_9BACT|nr:hypothetical protein [Chryseosolibacter histidini]MBT1700209.1 hypothetical protein [Chryseosolibacter histidini]